MKEIKKTEERNQNKENPLINKETKKRKKNGGDQNMKYVIEKLNERKKFLKR